MNVVSWDFVAIPSDRRERLQLSEPDVLNSTVGWPHMRKLTVCGLAAFSRRGGIAALGSSVDAMAAADDPTIVESWHPVRRRKLRFDPAHLRL
jgi:hypothetical protein